MSTQEPGQQRPAPYIPSKKPKTDFPLIDNDPHFFRVLRYSRKSDYAAGAAVATIPPGLLYTWELVAPSHVGKGGFAPLMRLNLALGAVGGFLFFYQRSAFRFYGLTENTREVAMDMREMVDKVKAGEPLYGKSEKTEYMQGVAHRNSRYTAIFFHAIPMFNFVNHNMHGVDTAKYYQQAERELEAEGLARKVQWKDDPPKK